MTSFNNNPQQGAMAKSGMGWAVEDMAVQIPAGRISLRADLTVPAGAKSVIVFAHGSGSGRHSPRNRHVAGMFNNSGFATLLADLLTEQEEEVDQETRHLRFDMPLLADRLMYIAQWLENDPDLRNLKIGYFGASTGGGAALIAAARQPENVMAVVSRGGRPDLAGDFLAKVKVPVLLIVGENDREVLVLNKQALERLHAEVRLAVIPGATHLFEEDGTLDEAARLATSWFEEHEPVEPNGQFKNWQ